MLWWYFHFGFGFVGTGICSLSSVVELIKWPTPHTDDMEKSISDRTLKHKLVRTHTHTGTKYSRRWSAAGRRRRPTPDRRADGVFCGQIFAEFLHVHLGLKLALCVPSCGLYSHESTRTAVDLPKNNGRKCVSRQTENRRSGRRCWRGEVRSVRLGRHGELGARCECHCHVLAGENLATVKDQRYRII